MAKRILVALLVVSSTGLFAGCGVTGNSDGVKVKINSVPASTVTFAISGSVISGTSSRFSFSRASSRKQKLTTNTNQCANANCSTIVIGGGGVAGPACSVSNGTFTIASVPQGQQLEAIFDCSGSTLKCIVMSGDTGVICDPVADGVIQAFLQALGKSNLSDGYFSGANIAQIAHSIEQASQNSNTASTTFINAISACASSATPKLCNLNAIKNSPFAGAFQMMLTMVSGWDAKALITFLTDVLNYTVSIDTLTFTDFGARLDSWIGTEFNAQVKALVSNVIADQNANGNNYPFKAICSFWYDRYQGGGQITYSPRMVDVTSNNQTISTPSCTDPNDGTGSLSLNGLSQAQINLINDAIVHNTNGQVNLSGDPANHPCSDPNGFADPLHFCVSPPEFKIAKKTTEVDRNDPLGTHQNNFFQESRANLISTFPAVEAALKSPNPPDPHTTGTGSGGSPCMNLPQDGAPEVFDDRLTTRICDTWFGNLVRSHRSDFSGVMGLYLAMVDHQLSANDKLSLNEIYTIFSDRHFLGEKLTLQGSGHNQGRSNGVKYQITATGEYRFLASLLNDSGAGVCTLDPIFYQGGGYTQDVSVEAAEGYYTASNINYTDSLKMFETIPTASSIRDSIFQTSYHVNFNPTGSSTYYANGNSNSPQGWSNADPIFCKMTDNSNNPIEIDMDTQSTNVKVVCVAASSLYGSGVRVDDHGNITVPSGFSYPYTIRSWGFQGDSQGGIFALADWKTGLPIAPNGKNQFIYQANANNPVCKTAGEYNTVVRANMAFGNGSNTYQQRVAAFCMDLSSFSSTSNESFYFAGTYQVPANTPYCPSCMLYGSLVGGYSSVGTSYSTPPVCLWSSSFATGNDGATSSTNASLVIDGQGHITSLGDIVVDYCSANGHSGTQYNLASFSYSPSSSPSTIFAQLLPSSFGSPISGATPLQFSPNFYEWISIDGARLNDAFVATKGVGYRVAPLSPPSNLRGFELANTTWNPKFDPFCDASNEPDSLCHCTDHITDADKSGSSCNLEDTPKDPTLSDPPYAAANSNNTPLLSFFDTYGGAELSTFTCGNVAAIFGGSGCTDGSAPLGWGNLPQAITNGSYWIQWNVALRCKFRVSGEGNYRRPTNLGPNWGSGAQGCPATDGAASATTGPVVLIKPSPMKNAYAILYPDAAVKMANYLTKDIGQGVTIDPSKKLFTFDTALALIAFRNLFPMTEISVTSGTTALPGYIGVYRPIASPGLNNSNSGHAFDDPLTSVHCYLKNSGQYCQ